MMMKTENHQLNHQLVVIFQFTELAKKLKININSKASIKNFRPLFASKLDYQFAHIGIKVNPKGSKELLPLDTPLKDIDYFKKSKQFYVVEVNILYEGG